MTLTYLEVSIIYFLSVNEIDSKFNKYSRHHTFQEGSNTDVPCSYQTDYNSLTLLFFQVIARIPSLHYKHWLLSLGPYQSV